VLPHEKSLIALFLMSVSIAPVMADEPAWAGKGKPTAEQKEAHKAAMEAKDELDEDDDGVREKKEKEKEKEEKKKGKSSDQKGLNKQSAEKAQKELDKGSDKGKEKR
jgi:hypothetical protein